MDQLVLTSAKRAISIMTVVTIQMRMQISVAGHVISRGARVPGPTPIRTTLIGRGIMAVPEVSTRDLATMLTTQPVVG